MNNELVPIQIKRNKTILRVKYDNILSNDLYNILNENIKYTIINIIISNKSKEIIKSENKSNFNNCIVRR